MPHLWTLLLLVGSNVFMTFAWYGHFKGAPTARPLVWVVLSSWGIALFEYALQVPANRIGASHGWSVAQLKTVQEVITLLVFAGFAAFYLGQPLTTSPWVGFGLIALGATFIFKPW